MAATAEARRRAAQDLREKLKLETSLIPQLRTIEVALVRQVTRQLGTMGDLPDVARIQSEQLEPVLLLHYDRVSDTFKAKIREDLPDEVAITEEEEDQVDVLLVALFAALAAAQARIIAATSAADARLSVNIARAEAQRVAAQTGAILSEQEVATTAGQVFNRKLRGRTGGIACFETQVAAEASKQTEAQVLVGPGEGDRGSKEWVNVGDSNVRVGEFDHVNAEQEVPSDQPFIVSGQRLMHPGDTSLGASIGNVAGCRCSSIPNVAGIANARR